VKPHDHKALKVITAEMDMTLQEIITTAVNDWLVKNGRQPRRGNADAPGGPADEGQAVTKNGPP
jgi:hypothetical protein